MALNPFFLGSNLMVSEVQETNLKLFFAYWGMQLTASTWLRVLGVLWTLVVSSERDSGGITWLNMALNPFFGVKFNGFSGPGDSFKAVFWLLGHAIDSINMV